MLKRDARGAATMGGLRLEDLLDLGTEPGESTERPRTPAYVYDVDAIVQAARDLSAGFEGAPHLIAYAVKANTAGPIVRALGAAGCGAEVVSGGELAVALGAGIPAESILFSGVAKTAREIDQAIGAGDRGILALQMESVEEIGRAAARARALGRKARVAFRVNPSIEADTHAHVATGHDEAKFGIALADLTAAYEAVDAADGALELVGIGCHIGSQLTRTDEYLEGARVVLDLAAERRAAGRPLAYLDLGGGYGIDYGAGCPVSPADFARAATRLVAERGFAGTRIVVEPGRALVAPYGVLCASVVMAKRSRGEPARRWLMIDAGMNDLIRPALYGAKHRIEPIDAPPPAAGTAPGYRVVGPVCESSDDFGEHPFADPLPRAVILRDAGAYGFVMASEYNGRGLPTEIFLVGGRVATIHHSRDAAAWAVSRLFG
ncbi:diaminopimelate decarboxylase [Polyangium sp. y55x31]|uniref:diaminopimelate decarboxylase n=1 Tax=Polyangium sp. y55x31 TaxID=3042688 RepID=UPI0024822831|nr:diaminopimelate decarboxylase [Polyangium sp. y55x31]MDI1483144.1 diaminopimelate decarboxylase [Polyangium sp. y55x31]